MPTTKARQRTGRGKASTRKDNAASAAVVVRRTNELVNLGRIWSDLHERKPQEFRLSCVRPDDLLVCDFVFENLRIDPAAPTPARLIRKDEQAVATLIVEFPPQSFGEQAFLDETGKSVPKSDLGNNPFPEKVPKSELFDPAHPDPSKYKPTNVIQAGDKAEPVPPLPGVKIRMAGRSRIAFTMPADETHLTLTIEAILVACRRWPMRLNINAVADPPLRSRAVAEVGNKYLDAVVKSESWVRATKDVFDVLGEEHRRAVSGAARRVARKAIAAFRSGRDSNTDRTVRTVFDEELEVLGARSPALRDPAGRQFAAAALSIMTTEAVANYNIKEEVFDLGKDFPFFHVVFGPHEPSKSVTALELPYRLILSPVPDHHWHHATKPISHNGRTELWHTRLTSSTRDIGPDLPARVRALWSPDYHLAGINQIVNGLKPFRMSLDPLDREMLVKVMSGFDEQTTLRTAYRPRTAGTKRLALSSLGALLDAEGAWPGTLPEHVSLEQWKHLASMGRDHYVRVVYRGYLKDLGHAASLVKVTERKFEGRSGQRIAVLRQRFFIVVRERVKHYTGAGQPHKGCTFNFTDVEIVTTTTPSLVAPDKPECRVKDPGGIIYGAGRVPFRACFWPMINAQNDFLFQMIGRDLSGKCHTFFMPLLFVGTEANERPDIMTEILARSRDELPPRRVADFNNESVCYAPMDPSAKGDTRLPTGRILFSAAKAKDRPSFEPQFYPEVEETQIGIAAIRRLLQQPTATVAAEFADAYRDTEGGFGAGNPGEVFLKLKAPNPLEFGGGKAKSDAIGGLATPSMAILGVSRIMGPVSGKAPQGAETLESKLGDIIANRFNPADFFKDAKILGGIPLASILNLVTSGLGGDNVPKLLSRDLPDRMEASFDWTTEDLKTDPAGLFVKNAGGTTSLTMHGVVSAPLASAAAPTFDANAALVHFKINLFGFVTVWFDRLRFAAKTGSKPDIAVDLHPGDQMIEFGGPLEFVNELRSIIPSNGFSDPPGLSVTPSGISASYSINIPSLAVGIFALEHVSLGAGFLLPFDGKPAEVRFNFAERQRPFSLTVSLLGGGGFFAICVGTEGVREIEAALEFGAALSINLGVASGSVEVKAGVYFHWKTASVELAGYVRLHGELSVLGLISASLTFNLQLAYLKEDGRSVVWGEASLEVEIEILFLSFSVSVSCRREFGGSNGDPKFIELIPNQATWNEYCDAFAGEAA